MKDQKDDFFTHPDLIRYCSQVIHHVLGNTPFVYVDSSAGTNQMALELRRPYYSVDLFAETYPQVHGHVDPKSWFDTRKTDLNSVHTPPSPSPSPSIRATLDRMPIAIGFNPPFDSYHRGVHAFVEHAVHEFQPQWMFWLIPATYHMKPMLAQWYDCIWCEQINGKVFYRPFTGMATYGLTPQFRIYQRRLMPTSTPNHQTKRASNPTRMDGVVIERWIDWKDKDTGMDLPIPWNRSFLVRRRGNTAGQNFLTFQENGQIHEILGRQLLQTWPSLHACQQERGKSKHSWILIIFKTTPFPPLQTVMNTIQHVISQRPTGGSTNTYELLPSTIVKIIETTLQKHELNKID